MSLFKRKPKTPTPEHRDEIREKAAQRMAQLTPAEITHYAEEYLGLTWKCLDAYKREADTAYLVEFLTNLSTLDGIADALAVHHV
ncbi:hypothetical protein [Nonomuraea sp. SYSU D8015]|uniref:hypothetical protein n=1 Tax=Nonomuraea sp. SYSU D8015 TaxID=2593644 RepID=UPI0016611251|nr:hypothetical protein [Nonomuraea sp. SYSU D8015]